MENIQFLSKHLRFYNNVLQFRQAHFVNTSKWSTSMEWQTIDALTSKKFHELTSSKENEVLYTSCMPAQSKNKEAVDIFVYFCKSLSKNSKEGATKIYVFNTTPVKTGGSGFIYFGLKLNGKSSPLKEKALKSSKLNTERNNNSLISEKQKLDNLLKGNKLMYIQEAFDKFEIKTGKLAPNLNLQELTHRKNCIKQEYHLLEKNKNLLSTLKEKHEITKTRLKNLISHYYPEEDQKLKLNLQIREFIRMETYPTNRPFQIRDNGTTLDSNFIEDTTLHLFLEAAGQLKEIKKCESTIKKTEKNIESILNPPEFKVVLIGKRYFCDLNNSYFHSEYLDKNFNVALKQKLECLHQLAQGVKFIISNKMITLDLKPRNMLCKEEEVDRESKQVFSIVLIDLSPMTVEDVAKDIIRRRLTETNPTSPITAKYCTLQDLTYLANCCKQQYTNLGREYVQLNANTYFEFAKKLMIYQLGLSFFNLIFRDHLIKQEHLQPLKGSLVVFGSCLSQTSSDEIFNLKFDAQLDWIKVRNPQDSESIEILNKIKSLLFKMLQVEPMERKITIEEVVTDIENIIQPKKKRECNKIKTTNTKKLKK